MPYSISPYKLNEDANLLIKKLYKLKDTYDIECKIISILNTISNDLKMSTYQLSLSHKSFADYYYSKGISQDALDHYLRAVELNPSISVKKRIKELAGIPSENRLRSISIDICNNIFEYEEYKHLLPKQSKDLSIRETSVSASVRNNRDAIYERALSSLLQEANEENSIYDPEHEADLDVALSDLPEGYKTDYYAARDIRIQENDGSSVLSQKEIDLLELSSIKRSQKFHEIHMQAVSKVDISLLKELDEAIILEAIEISFLKYINGRPADLSYLPGYWTHEHHLNYQNVLGRLFGGGYLEFADMPYVLSKSTVADLHSALKEHGLSIKGKKSELITCIIENLSKEECILEFPEKYLIATEKGFAAIQNYLNSRYLDCK